MMIFMGLFTIGCSNRTFSLNSAENLQSITSPIEITSKTISSENEALQSNIILPIFSGGNNEEFLNEINQLIEENSLKIKEEVSQMAEEDYEAFKDDDVPFFPYELMINYDIHTATNELLSFTTLNYQYTGGAHGHSVKIPYNFDLTTGKEIVLEDLFKKGSDYKRILNEEIQKQIKEDPEIFFPDEVELFSGIKENQPFYIKNGKLFIYFGQYDIAPYASGIIEFEIPSSILRSIIISPFII